MKGTWTFSHRTQSVLITLGNQIAEQEKCMRAHQARMRKFNSFMERKLANSSRTPKAKELRA